jgi:tetratricopeptide (TPR) repeat protein
MLPPWLWHGYISTSAQEIRIVGRLGCSRKEHVMRWGIQISAAAFFLVAFDCQGFAQTATSCAGSDAERSILACSFIIDAGAAKAADLAIAHYNRGNAYAALRRYEKAIEDYSNAISLHPRFQGAYNNRANALSALARYPEAINDYSQVLALDANHVGAYYNRGVSFAKLGQFERAVDDVTEAIRLEPDNANHYFTRALLYLRSGTRQPAISDLRATLQIDAAHEGAKQTLHRLGILPN